MCDFVFDYVGKWLEIKQTKTLDTSLRAFKYSFIGLNNLTKK